MEQALLQRAVGYEYTEDVYERKTDEHGEQTLVLTKQVRKHQPPDPKTAMWWLEHRDPARWGEGGGVEGGGVIEMPMVTCPEESCHSPQTDPKHGEAS